MSEEHNCEVCKFRNKYDENPNSFLGRLWRWHIRWCPGWSKYYKSASSEEQERLTSLYDLSWKK